MKKIIYLNAGHSEVEPGANCPNDRYQVESRLNMAIVEFLVPELERQGFEVKVVPHYLNFKLSYEWVNKFAKYIDSGLALDVHCNNSPDGYEGKKCGAETYYVGTFDDSKAIAKKLLDAYCKETGLKNGGAISDNLSGPGQISWLRQTLCWATLIECGYMDCSKDLDFIIENLDKIAKGIAKGVCAIYGIPYKSSRSREEIKQEIKNLVDLL